MSRKELLRYDDLIKKLKSDGINFNIVDEEGAKCILSEKTYYFKIGSFRKNFPKGRDNKYSIEFAYLEDLASLDMQLRYILLHFCLDLEHSLKSFIMHDITNNTDEDGYEIMADYFTDYTNQKDYIFNSVVTARDEDGKAITFHNGFEKYYNEPPIWVCLELMDFGQLVKFINFYYARHKERGDLNTAKRIAYLAKNLRNKCAHSKPILLHLTPDRSQRIPQTILSVGRSYYQLSVNQMSNKVYLDTIALFYLHHKYCNDHVKQRRIMVMKNWLERYERNRRYYSRSRDVNIYLSLLNKLIDKHL